VWLSTVTMFLMGFMWALVIGSIINLIKDMDGYRAKFKYLVDDMIFTLKQRGHAAAFRNKVRRYLRQDFDLRLYQHRQENIQTLSVSLQAELLVQDGMKQVCDCIWYLRGLKSFELVQLSSLFQVELHSPDEYIRRFDAVVVTRKGLCQHRGKTLGPYACFFEDMILTSTHHICGRRHIQRL